MPSAPPPVKPVELESACWNPASVRFGDSDPRTFAFNWLILGVDEGMPAHFIDRCLRQLRELGYDVRLTSASATPPELPVMTADERRHFKSGERMYWMFPNAIGDDE